MVGSDPNLEETIANKILQTPIQKLANFLSERIPSMERRAANAARGEPHLSAHAGKRFISELLHHLDSVPDEVRDEVVKVFSGVWDFESQKPRNVSEQEPLQDFLERLKNLPKMLRHVHKGQLGLELLSLSLALGTIQVTQDGLLPERHAELGLTLYFYSVSGEEEATLSGIDPRCSVGHLKSRLLIAAPWAPPYPEQRLVWKDILCEDSQSLMSLHLVSGSSITVVRVPYVCSTCQGGCPCSTCHGKHRKEGAPICFECGKENKFCNQCSGPCRCSRCHGKGSSCSKCGRRPVCWGGDTFVLSSHGARKVRDCRIGNDVRTLKGSRRISRIWSGISKVGLDTEVCCIDGVWITSHHLVVSGRQWIFPADLAATYLWDESLQIVRDLFNFELEGHEDTILLWGGGKWPVVVSCTLGKWVSCPGGHSSKPTFSTRRSTRCPHECVQCDAVFIDGLDFEQVSSDLRWATFPEFPQVEWIESEVCEFDLAEACKAQFTPLLCQLCKENRL